MVLEEAGLEAAVIIGARRIVGRHGCGLLLLLDRLAVDHLRVFMAVNVILLIVGCFLDPTSAIIVLTPLFMRAGGTNLGM